MSDLKIRIGKIRPNIKDLKDLPNLPERSKMPLISKIRQKFANIVSFAKQIYNDDSHFWVRRIVAAEKLFEAGKYKVICNGFRLRI